MSIITSSQNQIVQLVKKLEKKKYRQNLGLFIVEGIKFVKEIPAEWRVEGFVMSESFAKTADITDFAPAHIVTDGIFNSLTDTVNSQGILAIVRQRTFAAEDAMRANNPLILMLDGINDPGNMGTILRLAQSADAGVLLSEDCVDMYNPKVVRSAAGSFFHLKFAYADLEEAAAMLKMRGIKILAAMPLGARSLYDIDLAQPTAFLLGNEARGVSPQMAQSADERIKIPMIGAAESLNASMACGIMVYEALRQRHWN